MKKLSQYLLFFIGYLMLVMVYAKNASVIEGHRTQVFQISDKQVTSAILFYRLPSSRQFLQQALIHVNGQWLAELDGSQVQAPAVEYYLTFNNKDGSQKTYPAQYPRYNPLRLQVVAHKKLVIVMPVDTISPTQSKIVFNVEGEVSERERVYVNDVDVTDFIHREKTQWSFSNENKLFSGEAWLKITDDNGQVLATQKITFITKDKTSVGERELVLRGNASLNLGARSDSSNSSSEMSLSGNLHAETEYKEGDFKSHFSGVNINYQRKVDPEFNLSSGFLLSNSYQNKSLQYGDVSVSGTSLVLSGFSRRGLLFKVENKNTESSVFNVRTSPVEGWESGISFDERQTYGASWQHKLGDKKQSDIKLAVVSGDLQQAETLSVGSRNKLPQSGDTAGVQLNTKLAGVSVSAQVASSKFDQDTSDSVSAKRDNAYELKLKRDIYGLASSLGFHRYGANYATIANPNFSNDRQGLDISIGSQLQSLGWTGSFSSTRDNINNDITRPVVLSNNSGVNLNFTIIGWPSITFGANVSSQKSRNEPNLEQRVENLGQDISLGVSDTIGAYIINWSSSLGRLEDRLDTNKNSDTSNHSLSLAYSLDSIRLNLNLSQNKSRTVTTKTSDLINLSANFPLLSDKFLLNSQFSYQQNTASDNSQNNQVLGGSARVSWRLRDLFSSASSLWAQGQFSLNWTYNRNTDALNSANDTSDQRLLLEFSMGKPVQFENKWQF